MIEDCRNPYVKGDKPHYERVIVAVDPPITSGTRSDACGIIVAGLVPSGVGDVRGRKVDILHDGTVQGVSPESWAQRVIALWQSFDADYVLAEINQGGEMVATILNTINPEAVIKTVYASRGKVARAEPVAALYEQGRVRHVGAFSALEDELCLMGTGALKQSPDRADALVWAVTDLLLSKRAAPRIRRA